MALRYTFIALALFTSHQLTAQQPETHWWAPDGPIFATAVDPAQSTLYIAGQINQIGPRTPYHVALDPVTAQAMPGLQSDQQVLRHVPDGSGGWFGIGSFTRFGTVRRNRLVRMNSNGTLHPWHPQVDGTVKDLAYENGVVYLAGEFTTVNGVARAYAAAVDATTGTLLAWDPQPDGPVNGLAVVGNTTYLGGAFSTVGGQARANLCAVSTNDASLLAWAPTANGTVLLMRANTYGVVVRDDSNLRCFDLAGNALSTPTGSTFTTDIELVQDTVYVSGQLTVGGNIVFSVYAFPLNGEVFLTILPYGTVHSIAVSGTSLYLAGMFTEVQGETRYLAAQLDRFTGALAPWSPQLSGYGCDEVQPMGGQILVSGGFISVSGPRYTGLAALDLNTGQTNGWTPTDVQVVQELALYGDALYLFGSYFNEDGEPQAGLTAYDLANDQLMDWAPDMGGGYLTYMGIVGDTLIVAGGFTTFDGQPRTNIAAIDANTRELLDWAPSITNIGPSGLSDVAIDGNAVYFFGVFNTVGGLPRSNIAAVHRFTGAVMPWIPDVDPASIYWELDAKDGAVYISYQLELVGGGAELGITAVEGTAGTALWQVLTDQPIAALGITDTTLFIIGPFTTVGDVPRSGMAQLHRADGTLSDWDLTPEWCSTNYGTLDWVLPVGDRLFCSYSISTDSIITSPHLGVLGNPLPTTVPAVHPLDLELHAYPNPTSGSLQLEGLPPAADHLDVLDMTGRTVFRGRAVRTLDLHTLPTGAYSIRMHDRFGNMIGRTQVVLMP